MCEIHIQDQAHEISSLVRHGIHRKQEYSTVVLSFFILPDMVDIVCVCVCVYLCAKSVGLRVDPDRRIGVRGECIGAKVRPHGTPHAHVCA